LEDKGKQAHAPDTQRQANEKYRARLLLAEQAGT
jgi:hypothetical protein